MKVFVTKQPDGLLKAIRTLKRKVQDDGSMSAMLKLRNRYPKAGEYRREKAHRATVQKRRAASNTRKLKAWVQRQKATRATSQRTDGGLPPFVPGVNL